MQETNVAPLRIGIVGLVSSYSLLVADALSGVEGVRLVGAAALGRDDRYMAGSVALPWLARFPKTAAGYAKRFGVPVYGTVEALYDAGVDAVVLGTEEYLRTRYAIGGLERGIHVYLPKPFAYTAEDVQRLREAAAKSTATLFPGLPHRWSAPHRRAAELLVPERLGHPLMMRSAITHHLSPGPWKSDPTMAAGPEFEMGFYAVDALLMLAGSPARRVSAQAANLIHKGIEGFDFAKCHVEFASGAIGTADFYCGVHYPFRGQELEAVARDGGIWLGRDAGGKTLLRVYRRTGDEVEDVPPLGRHAELAYWADLCRRGDRDAAAQWLETGCATLATLLAFRQAWQTGQTVEVQEL
ncbi:MAG: Gfo/Idh/MocA family oxidoreductase [Chloroflexi bacterium]|nr:Gfo/Idh/MocA family oxidoreductase [Chloroflexota bacterium]